jgi:beta-phosphoglucomutase-like phosphatase (HAD superfamily)
MNAHGFRQAMESAKGVAFDFDGTLVDSNNIKRLGFDHAFAEYPDRMREIREYCYGSNHTIRGEKFRYVTEKVLGLEYTPELNANFHKRYAEFTTESVIAAPEIPGAADFVRSLAALQPSLLSSTPTEILMEILRRRGWADLFHVVQGAPVNKRAWLRGLQSVVRCEPAQILFFGDTDEDAQSALAAGCTFVRVGNPAADFADYTDLVPLVRRM